jgi:hypothetical protein
MVGRVLRFCAIAIVVGAALPAAAEDLSKLDLSGEWYVLVHWKDDRSKDKSLKKFEDFAWSIKHEDKKIGWGHFPYVMFHEDLELVRRDAMRNHKPWEPTPGLWKRIRKSIRVSSRAAATKTLRGSREKGYESLPPMAAAGANMISFTRDWKVGFSPEKVRIQITDSLSGGSGLEGVADSTVYEITERVADDELAGSYSEPHKKGSFRMVRSRERAPSN